MTLIPRFFIVLVLGTTTLAAAEPAGAGAEPGDAPGAPPAAAAATKPAEPTAYARRVMYLSPGIGPDPLQYMIASAAAEHANLVGLSKADAEDVVRADTNVNAGRVTLELTVRTFDRPDAKPNALPLLDAITDSLMGEIRRSQLEQVGLDRKRLEADRASQEADHEREKLARLEQVIRGETGRVDASVEAIRAAVPKLEEERQALKLQVVGKRARQKAVAETIDRLAKTAGERVQNDPVAAELEKIVQAREVGRDRARKLLDRNAGTAEEVAAAEGDIAEARARLFERRETVTQTNGGELLTGMNRELATLSIDVAEAEAKLAAIEEQLKRYGAVQDLLRRFEDGRRSAERREAESQRMTEAVRQATTMIPDAPLRIVQTQTLAPHDARLKAMIDRERRDRESRMGGGGGGGGGLFGGTPAQPDNPAADKPAQDAADPQPKP